MSRASRRADGRGSHSVTRATNPSVSGGVPMSQSTSRGDATSFRKKLPRLTPAAPDVDDALAVQVRREGSSAAPEIDSALVPADGEAHAVREYFGDALVPRSDEPLDVRHRPRNAFSTAGHQSLRHHPTVIRSTSPPYRALTSPASASGVVTIVNVSSISSSMASAICSHAPRLEHAYRSVWMSPQPCTLSTGR